MFLRSPDDVLLARWEASPRAPLTDLPPREELARQKAEREDHYRRWAEVTVDTSLGSPDEVAEEIAAALQA